MKTLQITKNTILLLLVGVFSGIIFAILLLWYLPIETVSAPLETLPSNISEPVVEIINEKTTSSVLHWIGDHKLLVFSGVVVLTCITGVITYVYYPDYINIEDITKKTLAIYNKITDYMPKRTPQSLTESIIDAANKAWVKEHAQSIDLFKRFSSLDTTEQMFNFLDFLSKDKESAAYLVFWRMVKFWCMRQNPTTPEELETLKRITERVVAVLQEVTLNS